MSSSLSREQKIASILLLFLGIGGLFFGFRSFPARLNKPYLDKQLAYEKSGERFLTQDAREQEQQLLMKNLDTDEDGLSDYDEAFVFKTSAYLADTDSDGFGDKQEIDSGNNPLCPSGQTCGQNSAEVVASPSLSPGSLLPEQGTTLSSIPLFDGAPTQSFQSAQDIEAYLQTLTPEQVREALFLAGLPKEQLDLLSDADLKALLEQSAQEILQESATSDPARATITPTP